ncbi:thiamine biosynthesis protein ThiF [Sulfurimonas sp.]
MIVHGFNLDDDLVCEGIIGDGCGGGRIFAIKNENLVAFDPQTQQYITLLEDIINPKKISKNGCIISIELQSNLLKFDLSLLSIV